MGKEELARVAAFYIDWCEEQSEAGVPGYARMDGERVHYLRLIGACLDRKLWGEVKDLVGAITDYLDLQGWWAEQLTALEMNLTVARKAGDRRDEALCLNDLGCTCTRRGEPDQALVWYEQCLPVWREVKDRHGEGVVLNNIAKIYRQQGRYDEALEQYEQSLSIRQEIGDREGEGWTLNNIATFYLHQEQWETALPYFEQCLPIWQEVGNKLGEGTTLNNITAIYDAQGKPGKAVEYREQALAIFRDRGDRAREAVTCWNIGLTYYEDMDDLAQAEEHIRLAVEIAEAIGHPALEQFRDGLEQVRTERRGA